MGFTPGHIDRAFRVYEKNYGHSYNVDVFTELIIRLQKKDKLKKRRKYERQEIRRLEDDRCPRDCAINMKWLNHWKNFVKIETNAPDIPPGIINNRDICMQSRNHTLKEGLIEGTDYLMIPSQIWTFFIGIYGGGPKIVPINTSKRTHNRNETEDDTVNHKSDAPANGNTEEKHHPLSHDTQVMDEIIEINNPFLIDTKGQYDHEEKLHQNSVQTIPPFPSHMTLKEAASLVDMFTDELLQNDIKIQNTFLRKRFLNKCVEMKE
eukprot:937151_1